MPPLNPAPALVFWGWLSRLLAPQRTWDEPPSLPGPNRRLRCGRESRSKWPISLVSSPRSVCDRAAEFERQRQMRVEAKRAQRLEEEEAEIADAKEAQRLRCRENAKMWRARRHHRRHHHRLPPSPPPLSLPPLPPPPSPQPPPSSPPADWMRRTLNLTNPN